MEDVCQLMCQLKHCQKNRRFEEDEPIKDELPRCAFGERFSHDENDLHIVHKNVPRTFLTRDDVYQKL